MLRWMDGIEHYGTTETHMVEGVGGGAAWSQVDTLGWSISTVAPATGTYHMRLNDDNDERLIRRIFGTANQITGIGYRFNTDELPERETNPGLVMADIRDVSNGAHNMIVMGTDGSVISIRGADTGNLAGLGGTTLGRSEPCIASGGYHHFEVKTKIANSGGYVEVRVNEVTVLNLTGIDTQNTGNASAAQFALGVSAAGSGNLCGFNIFDLDDVFAWDDIASDAENTVIDFVGDKGCYYLPTTADTAEADWTLSTGATGYTLLDEVIPNDADYIADTTGVARSIFQVAALPANVSEVIALMPVIRARKEESGSVTIRGGIVVGGDESYAPDNSPSTAFAYMAPGPKTVDPSTGVAWANDANPDLLIERTV